MSRRPRLREQLSIVQGSATGVDGYLNFDLKRLVAAFGWAFGELLLVVWMRGLNIMCTFGIESHSLIKIYQYVGALIMQTGK